MARQAKIYFQDQLAGVLIEGDNGYLFHYEKDYLNSPNPKAISLTLPLSQNTYHNKVLFPFSVFFTSIIYNFIFVIMSDYLRG